MTGEKLCFMTVFLQYICTDKIFYRFSFTEILVIFPSIKERLDTENKLTVLSKGPRF